MNDSNDSTVSDFVIDPSLYLDYFNPWQQAPMTTPLGVCVVVFGFGIHGFAGLLAICQRTRGSIYEYYYTLALLIAAMLSAEKLNLAADALTFAATLCLGTWLTLGIVSFFTNQDFKLSRPVAMLVIADFLLVFGLLISPIDLISVEYKSLAEEIQSMATETGQSDSVTPALAEPESAVESFSGTGLLPADLRAISASLSLISLSFLMRAGCFPFQYWLTQKRMNVSLGAPLTLMIFWPILGLIHFASTISLFPDVLAFLGQFALLTLLFCGLSGLLSKQILGRLFAGSALLFVSLIFVLRVLTSLEVIGIFHPGAVFPMMLMPMVGLLCITLICLIHGSLTSSPHSMAQSDAGPAEITIKINKGWLVLLAVLPTCGVFGNESILHGLFQQKLFFEAGAFLILHVLIAMILLREIGELVGFSMQTDREKTSASNRSSHLGWLPVWITLGTVFISYAKHEFLKKLIEMPEEMALPFLSLLATLTGFTLAKLWPIPHSQVFPLSESETDALKVSSSNSSAQRSFSEQAEPGTKTKEEPVTGTGSGNGSMAETNSGTLQRLVDENYYLPQVLHGIAFPFVWLSHRIFGSLFMPTRSLSSGKRSGPVSQTAHLVELMDENDSPIRYLNLYLLILVVLIVGIIAANR